MDKREKIDAHVLDRYEVGHIIGKGAYGIVWKAIDRKNGSPIALKKIFDGFQNITDAQRTYREVMILQNLRHKNIVKLLNVIRAENHVDLYLAFEHIETDLHAVIRAGILEDIHKKYIIYQLLKVLKFLHSADIIHRDIKPSNLLLNSECFMKLADFGLARMVDPANNCYEEPILTDYVATRWYRAPEILLGSTKYSKGVDIWSVGCIMAELINGRPLFPGSSTVDQLTRVIEMSGRPTRDDLRSCCSVYAESMMQNIVVRQRRTLRHVFPRAHPEAIDLMERLLAFSPARRFTAEDALEHPYVGIFHNPDEEPNCRRQIDLLMNENKKATIEQYRERLYEQLRARRRKKVQQLEAQKARDEAEQEAAAEAAARHLVEQRREQRRERRRRHTRTRSGGRSSGTRALQEAGAPAAVVDPVQDYIDGTGGAPRLMPVRGASDPRKRESGNARRSKSTTGRRQAFIEPSASSHAEQRRHSKRSRFGGGSSHVGHGGHSSSSTKSRRPRMLKGGSFRKGTGNPKAFASRSTASGPTAKPGTGGVGVYRNGGGGMALRQKRESRRESRSRKYPTGPLAPIKKERLTGRRHM